MKKLKELESRVDTLEKDLTLVLKVLHSHQTLLEKLMTGPKLITPDVE